jgi:hypothetical protein
VFGILGAVTVPVVGAMVARGTERVEVMTSWAEQTSGLSLEQMMEARDSAWAGGPR